MNPVKPMPGVADFLRSEAGKNPTICASDYPQIPNAAGMLNYLLARGELEVVLSCIRGRRGLPAILRKKRP